MQWQTKLPLIAILRGIKPDEALAHVGAVIDAGFDAVEIPLNSPQWEQSIPAIVDAYGDKALIGAGTVLKPEQVDALARMGCQLIVTPNIHSEVIRRAVGYGMTVCPGCATATEAFTALEAGAQALKIQNRDAQAVQRQRVADNFPGSDAYYNYVLTLFGQGWDQHRFRFSTKGELLPDWGQECANSH